MRYQHQDTTTTSFIDQNDFCNDSGNKLITNNKSSIHSFIKKVINPFIQKNTYSSLPKFHPINTYKCS